MRVNQLLGMSMPINDYGTSNKLCDNDTFLGLEFEVEGVTRHLPLNLLEGVRDDSLRNNGLELRFAQPLKGAYAANAINEFLGLHTEFNFVSSYRTSMHVHVDVRTMDFNQIMAFIITYMILERGLFNFVGHNRHDNMYCLPLYKAEGDVGKMYTLLSLGKKTTTREQAQDALHSYSKYSAINIGAIRDKGTIEFRHMLTTFDSDRIYQWVNMLLHIKQYAEQYVADKSVYTLTSHATSAGYKDFYEEVLGQYARSMLYQHTQIGFIKGIALAGSVVHHVEEQKELKRKDKHNLLQDRLNGQEITKEKSTVEDLPEQSNFDYSAALSAMGSVQTDSTPVSSAYTWLSQPIERDPRSRPVNPRPATRGPRSPRVNRTR